MIHWTIEERGDMSMETLETSRLILRGWQENDIDDLFDIFKDESVIMGGWKPNSNITISAELLNKYIENNDHWAIELKDRKKVIGCVGFCLDNNRGKFYAKSVNFVLSKDYRGNGYMTEAVKRVVQYMFEEINIDLLSAFHIPDNISSKRILERCGFEYEITIKQGYKRYDGHVFDSICYSIMKSNYVKNIINH